MEKKELSEKLTYTFYLEAIAAAIVLACIGLCFIGPFYIVKVEGEKVGFGLSSLLSGEPLGMGVGVFLVIFVLAIPIVSVIMLILSQRIRTLLFVGVIGLLVAALGCVVLNTVVAKMDGVKSIEFCGFLPAISLFIAAGLSFFNISAKEEFSIFDIVETGMLIAMAVALSLVRLFRMPTGGSVNLQMLPLFILTLRRGPLKGFIGAGIVYGLITCLTDGYGFATYPFDYVLGFGSVAVLGFFLPLILGKDQIKFNLKGEVFLFIGCLLATCIRFVASTASSMIIYDYEFAPAAIYNVGYVFVSGAISMAVLMALYGPLARIHVRFPVKAL